MKGDVSRRGRSKRNKQISGSPSTETGTARPAPVTWNPWHAILTVSVVAFMLVTTEYLPIGLLPEIATDLDVTYGIAGLTVTLPAFVATASALVISASTGTLDRRTVLAGLAATLVAGNGIALIAQDLMTLLTGRVLVGIALGGFWPIGITIGARLMPEPTGTRGMTIIFGGFALGTIAGVPAGTLFGSVFGWRFAFGAAGAISLVAAVALLSLLPNLPPRHPARWRDMPALLTVPQARLGLFLAAMTFGGTFLAYPYLAPFLKIVSHLDAKGISLMLLVFGAAGFLGNIGCGALAARDIRMAMVITSAGLAFPAALLALLGTSPVATTILVGIWGAAYGGLSIVCQSWCAKAAPIELERGGGLFTATIFLFVALGTWAGGAVVDVSGVVAVMFVGGAISLIAAPAAWIFGRVQRNAA